MTERLYVVALALAALAFGACSDAKTQAESNGSLSPSASSSSTGVTASPGSSASAGPSSKASPGSSSTTSSPGASTDPQQSVPSSPRTGPGNQGPGASRSPSPSPSPVVKHLSVRLTERGDTGWSGTATLDSLSNGRTRVVLTLEGAGSGTKPAAIRRGRCSSMGDIAYQLDVVRDGRSETVVNEALKVLASGKLVVWAGEGGLTSEDLPGACGNIPKR